MVMPGEPACWIRWRSIPWQRPGAWTQKPWSAPVSPVAGKQRAGSRLMAGCSKNYPGRLFEPADRRRCPSCWVFWPTKELSCSPATQC